MNIVSRIADRLERHGVPSSTHNAEIILSTIMRCRLVDLYIEEKILNPRQLRQLDYIVSQRIAKVPLQYIIGSVNFYGNELFIEPGVFIPRPETEILVDTVMKKVSGTCARSLDTSAQVPDTLSILDLCTGCGNIAISLAKAFSHCRIVATDISRKALELGRRNATRHNLSERIDFIQADLFNMPSLYLRSYGIIISNPPYLSHCELAHLPGEVRREPEEALNGGSDGMNFYLRISETSPLFLKKDGFIALELGDEISDRVAELFKKSGRFSRVRLIEDLNGLKRVMTAQKA